MFDQIIVRILNEKFQLSSSCSIGLNIPIGFSGEEGGSFLGMGSSREITNGYHDVLPVRIAGGMKLNFTGLKFNEFNIRPQLFATLDVTSLAFGKRKYIANFLTGISFVFERT